MNGPVLALETSCDDTCAAVVGADATILSNVISSQGVHDAYGGVVPEIAARSHLELVGAVVDDALARAGTGLDDIEAIAVTQGPGLVGALLVGLSAAKGIAAGSGRPLIAVDHLQGHVSANFARPEPFEPPFVALVASGGHTLVAAVRERSGYELLGQTIDDAAGEAFDKGARMLGLGFPGGPALERLAREGDPEAFAFPVADRVAGLDFSFSGVKTALLYAIRDLGSGAQERSADLAASYQEAIVTALVRRLEQAVETTGIERVAIGGGVAANGPLRERVGALGVEWHAPEMALCTDNAAMIGIAALSAQALAPSAAATLEPYATSGARRMSPVVTVYSRRDCHLCDEALAALDSIDREGLVVEVVDIEGDDALLARYLERIPVIALDGVELYEFRLDVDDLNQRLEAAAGR